MKYIFLKRCLHVEYFFYIVEKYFLIFSRIFVKKFFVHLFFSKKIFSQKKNFPWTYIPEIFSWCQYFLIVKIFNFIGPNNLKFIFESKIYSYGLSFN